VLCSRHPGLLSAPGLSLCTASLRTFAGALLAKLFSAPPSPLNSSTLSTLLLWGWGAAGGGFLWTQPTLGAIWSFWHGSWCDILSLCGSCSRLQLYIYVIT
jgi:hypothetical protein